MPSRSSSHPAQAATALNAALKLQASVAGSPVSSSSDTPPITATLTSVARIEVMRDCPRAISAADRQDSSTEAGIEKAMIRVNRSVSSRACALNPPSSRSVQTGALASTARNSRSAVSTSAAVSAAKRRGASPVSRHSR